MSSLRDSPFSSNSGEMSDDLLPDDLLWYPHILNREPEISVIINQLREMPELQRERWMELSSAQMERVVRAAIDIMFSPYEWLGPQPRSLYFEKMAGVRAGQGGEYWIVGRDISLNKRLLSAGVPAELSIGWGAHELRHYLQDLMSDALARGQITEASNPKLYGLARYVAENLAHPIRASKDFVRYENQMSEGDARQFGYAIVYGVFGMRPGEFANMAREVTASWREQDSTFWSRLGRHFQH